MVVNIIIIVEEIFLMKQNRQQIKHGAWKQTNVHKNKNFYEKIYLIFYILDWMIDCSSKFYCFNNLFLWKIYFLLKIIHEQVTKQTYSVKSLWKIPSNIILTFYLHLYYLKVKLQNSHFSKHICIGWEWKWYSSHDDSSSWKIYLLHEDKSWLSA